MCVSEDEKWMDGMRIQLVNRRSFVAVVAMAEVVAMPRLWQCRGCVVDGFVPSVRRFEMDLERTRARIATYKFTSVSSPE